MIQMGRYTSALLLIATGVALVVDQTSNTQYMRLFVDWWPFIFIALGIEVILLSLIYRKPDARLRFSFESVISAIAITFMALLLTGFGEGKVNIENWRFWEYGFKTYERPAVTTALQPDTSKIRITNTNGDVVLRTGDTDEIVIESTIRYFNILGEERAREIESESASSIEVTQGETLEINIAGKRYRYLLWRVTTVIDVTITLPRDHSLDYEIELRNGDLALHDLQVRNRVKAETRNGDILVRDTAGELDVLTRNGDVEVSGVESALKVRTNNGDISVGSSVINGDWKVETNNGDITLRVPEQGDYRIAGERNVGDFSTSISWLKISRDRIEGQIGEGTYSIDAETNNGDIEISYYRD